MTLASLPPELIELGRRLQAMAPEQRTAVLASMSPEQTAALVQSIEANPLLKASIGATGKLTAKQVEATSLLDGRHRHVLLVGGSRSGKTWAIVRKLVERALTATCSQVILRYRFNALHASIIEGTFPRVMAAHFPAAEWKLDKQLWHVKFGNGSVIWYSGLDEADRVEKVLGQGHAGLFLNEASQIPWGSREVAVTRLAEKVEGVPQLMVCDCNPPSRSHWTHRLYVAKVDPSRNEPLVNPDAYAWLRMNPRDNEEHLDAAYFDDLNALDERRRKRFLLGEFTDDTEDALWTLEALDRGRILGRPAPPMQRVVVAVDPSGCRGPEDLRSDEGRHCGVRHR
jgi:phage terminase large subunit-like protein